MENRTVKKLFLILNFILLAQISPIIQADSHEGWFYIGEFNLNKNSFDKSYFNAKNYPVVGDRLIALHAVNMRDDKPTQKGQLGKKVGIILKNHILVVTQLVKGYPNKGIEDVWVKGYIEKPQ